MAGEKNTVETVVKVKYESSGVLNEFIRDLDRVGREGQKAGAGIRNLVAPLAFELAPALGTTGGALARVAGSAAVMTTGLGALAVAVTSLAGLVTGQLVESWKKVREEQEKWIKSMSSGDVGQITGAINTQVDKVRELAKAYAELEARAGTRSLKDLLSLQAPEARRTQAGRELITEFGKIDEGARIRATIQQSIEQQRAEDKGMEDAKQYIAQNQRRRDEEAARLAKERQDRINQLNRERFGGGDFGGDEALAFLGGKPLEQVIREQEESPIIQAYRQDILGARGDLNLEVGAPTPEEVTKGFRLVTAEKEKQAQLNDKLLQTEVDRAKILLEQEGLTRQQTTLLSEMHESARQIAIEGSSTLTVEEKKVELLRLQVDQSNRLRKNLEEESGLAGLAAGFRDVADEAELAGKTMRRFAQETARSMQQSFSDLFFNVMTGNFKSLADVGKQFGQSVARSVSDALAKEVSAPILSGLSGLGGNLSFFGNAASGGGALTQEQLVSLQASGVGATGTTGAATTGGGLLGSIGALGGSLAGLTSLFSSPSSVSAVEGAGVGGSREFVESSPLGTGTEVSGGGFGFNAGTAGGIAGLALVAASIGYGATQKKGKTPSPGSRALGGALMGASYGSVFGIYGMAIGAVVGLFVGVATSDAKDTAARKAMQRGDAWDVEQFRPAFEGDLNRVRAAQSYEDLAVAISGALHEAYGGPRNRGTREWVAGFAFYIGGMQVILAGGAYAPTMTVDDLATLLETDADSFSAELQLGVAAQVRRQISQIFEQAVKDQAELIGRLNATAFAYDDVGPGLRRTTILPAGALRTTDISGHQIMVDRAGGAALGLTDAQMDTFIRQFADRNTQTDRIPDFTAELRLQL
jgi:hypothetical protein